MEFFLYRFNIFFRLTNRVSPIILTIISLRMIPSHQILDFPTMLQSLLRFSCHLENNILYNFNDYSVLFGTKKRFRCLIKRGGK